MSGTSTFGALQGSPQSGGWMTPQGGAVPPMPLLQQQSSAPPPAPPQGAVPPPMGQNPNLAAFGQAAQMPLGQQSQIGVSNQPSLAAFMQMLAAHPAFQQLAGGSVPSAQSFQLAPPTVQPPVTSLGQIAANTQFHSAPAGDSLYVLTPDEYARVANGGTVFPHANPILGRQQ